jgi:hypothetical protein
MMTDAQKQAQREADRRAEAELRGIFATAGANDPDQLIDLFAREARAGRATDPNAFVVHVRRRKPQLFAEPTPQTHAPLLPEGYVPLERRPNVAAAPRVPLARMPGLDPATAGDPNPYGAAQTMIERNSDVARMAGLTLEKIDNATVGVKCRSCLDVRSIKAADRAFTAREIRCPAGHNASSIARLDELDQGNGRGGYGRGYGSW